VYWLNKNNDKYAINNAGIHETENKNIYHQFPVVILTIKGIKNIVNENIIKSKNKINLKNAFILLFLLTLY